MSCTPIRLIATALLYVAAIEPATAIILQQDCPNGPKAGYPEHRRGLVIGVAEYPDPALDLPNSVRDVKAIGSVLCELGFHVISAINSDKSEIDKLIREFGAKNRPGEVRLFYFSGHGVQKDESNYLVPAKFNPRAIEGSTVELATLLEHMADPGERGQRSQKIIILDACRDNRLGATKGLTLPRDAPRDSWIAFATAPGLTSRTGTNGGLSAYTEALITHRRRPGLSISEMFAAVREEQWRKARVLSWDNISSFGLFWFQPPPEFKVAIFQEDDVVTVTVNGQAVASGTGESKIIPYSLLRTGDNLLEIIVYNQKTRRNGQPWERKEGWSYRVEVEIPQAGKCILLGGRDNLDADASDSEWGRTFIARRGKLVVTDTGAVFAREFEDARTGTDRSTSEQLRACK